ncbi:extracellular solute-binding protein [Paenibacillus thalictri]|uniref:Extracellular solute-binding protein n=1 Tax=Paenibacillus thalictri TaxID=2527873 RepID=A0A4Q9DWB1_9BACL|nr:extracellular solute-binding protein [Paenibacillus thalictri]TBL80112.1 extracellular solute-binding protein [Paenibacillus thalictri]
MSSKWSKRLTVSVTGVLLAGSLAACSSGQEASTTGGSGTAQGGASGAPANSQAASGTKISDKERTVRVVFAENPNQPIKNNSIIQQEILKQTNMKLEYEAIPTSNYTDKKKTLIATNNLPDIIQLDKQDLNDFGSTGVFLPLLDYMKKGLMPNFKKFWDANPDMVKMTVDGELYAFPAIARNEAKNGFGPVIRTDLLKKHQLAEPKTFDELLTVLAKLKELYPDSKPWSIRNGTQQLLATSAYMLGSGFNKGNPMYFDKDVEGGKYVFGPASPAFKNVLSYFNKAYKMGVLDTDYATSTQQQWTEKLTSGKSFFFLDNSGFGLNNTRDLRKSQQDATFQVLPIPEYAPGKARANFYATVFTGKTFAISAKAKDPEQLIKLLDWMYSEPASNLMNFGIEGTNYTLDEKGQPKFKEDYVAKFKTSTPTPYYALYSDLGCCQLSFTPYYTNTMTQFQVEKMTGNWDALNDEYWKIVGSDKAYVEPVMDPPLNKQEAARVRELNVTLNTMLDQEYDKFIMGVKKIDEYDAVIKKAREMGATELEKIYNDALARLKK